MILLIWFSWYGVQSLCCMAIISALIGCFFCCYSFKATSTYSWWACILNALAFVGLRSHFLADHTCFHLITPLFDPNVFLVTLGSYEAAFMGANWFMCLLDFTWREVLLI